jgi:uncharacterized protein
VRSGSSIPEPGDTIRIRYRRPPDREELFEQRLLAREGGAVVTLLENAAVKRPSEIDGVAVLEPGSPIVWISFAGERHDVGRFHRADGTFTGLYANILTPVEGLESADWVTTDLFLDVWLPAGGGEARLLDADELGRAVELGWIDDATAAAAIAEAARLLDEAHAGSWPPPVVHEWTLERARAELRHNGPASV